MSSVERGTEAASSSRRKPYTTPRVISYGSVKDLVQGGGGMSKDSDNFNTKSCWIAEALYGAGDPRTMLLRAWVGETYVQKRRGWAFAALYMKVGRRVASLIECGYVPRQPARLLFDRLLQKAFDDAACAIRAAHR